MLFFLSIIYQTRSTKLSLETFGSRNTPTVASSNAEKNIYPNLLQSTNDSCSSGHGFVSGIIALNKTSQAQARQTKNSREKRGIGIHASSTY